jgi:glycosyltransferase involved in cell wall biosynthesis
MNILQIGVVSISGGGVSSYIKSIVSRVNVDTKYFIGVVKPEGKINNVKFINFDMRYNLLTLINRVLKLNSHVKINKIDLIHAHTQRAGLIGALLKKTNEKICVIYTPHGFRHTQLKGVSKFIHYLIELFILKNIDKMTAITDFEMKEIPKYSHKMVKIKSVIDTNVKPEKINLKKVLNIRESTKIVAMLGSVDDRKQPYLFIDIANKVKEDIYFIWVGAGDKYSEVNEYIKEKKMTNKVHFMGGVDRSEVYGILSNIDALLMTSSSEGFPLSILEAYFAGKTVISNDFLGVEEIVKNNENGIVFEFNNSSAAALKLDEVLFDDTYLLDLQNNAKEFVVPYTDFGRFTDVYLNLYCSYKT